MILQTPSFNGWRHMTKTRAILTDIEGTTTDIHFVHQVLFPYSRAKMRSFVLSNHHTPHVREAILDVLKTIEREDIGRPKVPFGQIFSQNQLEEACSHLDSWIASDRKHPALKKLQGNIWKEGYEEKRFLGHVYPDVPIQLRTWKSDGLLLSVYSSGSVEAQKLLFGHTEYGNLNDLFSCYFDTSVGAKRSSASYNAIFNSLSGYLKHLEPNTIVFLTDILEEAESALQAGLRPIILNRNPQGDKLESESSLPENIPLAKNFFEVAAIIKSS